MIPLARLGGRQRWRWSPLTPSVRVVITLAFIVLIALLPAQRWRGLGVYALGIGAIALSHRLSRQISLRDLGRHLAIELPFVWVMGLTLLFHPDQPLLWQWGPLKLSQPGLLLTLNVWLKAGLSLLAMNLLTLTQQQLLDSLRALRVPPLLVALMGTLLRYGQLFQTEAIAMQQAAASRNWSQRHLSQRNSAQRHLAQRHSTSRGSAHSTARRGFGSQGFGSQGFGSQFLGSQLWGTSIVAGNLIGALFVRTYERSERIHQARLARGEQLFRRSPPARLGWQSQDYWALAGAIAGLGIGYGL